MTILAILALIIFFLYREGKLAKKKGRFEPIARVAIAGKELHCRFCKNEDFHRRETLSGFSIKDLINGKMPVVTKVTYTCTSCRMVHEFQAPTESLRIITVESEGFETT